MPEKKSISRSLGEFFGHILRGARTGVDDRGNEVIRKEVKRTVEEEDRGDMVLRRTTIEEVELRKSHIPDAPESPREGTEDSQRE